MVFNPFIGYDESFGHQLRVPLKAGVTYTFLVDVAYAANYSPWYSAPQVPIPFRINGGQQSCPSTLLWSKLIPTARTNWQTDTVIVTPSVDITHLQFVTTGSASSTQGALLIDNLRTLTGIVLKKEDGTAEVDGKQFRLL